MSGTKYVGEMEDRIKKLAGELEAHPDVILFIDEIHTIVGAGSTESSNNDISNMPSDSSQPHTLPHAIC